MAPDWWFAQFERDLAEYGDRMSYDAIAEGVTDRFIDRVTDEADQLRQIKKEQDK